MKRASLTAIIGIFVVLAACASVRSAQYVSRISKDELKAKLGSPAVVVLDVRAQNDWERSVEKIAGSVRMDPEAFDKWADTLPRDKEIILYCS